MVLDDHFRKLSFYNFLKLKIKETYFCFLTVMIPYVRRHVLKNNPSNGDPKKRETKLGLLNLSFTNSHKKTISSNDNQIP